MYLFTCIDEPLHCRQFKLNEYPLHPWMWGCGQDTDCNRKACSSVSLTKLTGNFSLTYFTTIHRRWLSPIAERQVSVMHNINRHACYVMLILAVCLFGSDFTKYEWLERDLQTNKKYRTLCDSFDRSCQPLSTEAIFYVLILVCVCVCVCVCLCIAWFSCFCMQWQLEAFSYSCLPLFGTSVSCELCSFIIQTISFTLTMFG
jgi:hypothetical protein